MCKREEPVEAGEKSPGAKFGKGAMEYLSSIPNISVIATDYNASTTLCSPFIGGVSHAIGRANARRQGS